MVGTLVEGERRVLARGRVSTDSIFEIGSVTKVFTALLLARLAQDGRVELDRRPVRGRALTLAELASHTAGLPRLPRGFLLRALRHPRDPYARFGARELEQAVRNVRVRSGRVRYSNFGAGLLGHALGLSQGVGYAELVAREICTPLRMDDTFLVVPEDKRGRFARGHDRRGKPVPHWHFDALAGAGGLRSTASDLLTFLAFQLDPPDSPLGAAAALTQVPRARRGRQRIGLGWLRTPLDRAHEDVVWHNGGTGGFRSFVGFMPASRVGVVVLSNCARGTDEIGMRVLQALRSTATSDSSRPTS